MMVRNVRLDSKERSILEHEIKARVSQAPRGFS